MVHVVTNRRDHKPAEETGQVSVLSVAARVQHAGVEGKKRVHGVHGVFVKWNPEEERDRVREDSLEDYVERADGDSRPTSGRTEGVVS